MIVVASPDDVVSREVVRAFAARGSRALGAETSCDDPLNAGVFHQTNPTLVDGALRYLFPEPLEGHFVWMSVAGLRRSDPAYLERVLAVIPSWRTSEDRAAWLRATYRLLHDAVKRGVPTWFIAYDGFRGEGERDALASWLGVEADAIPDVFPHRRVRRDVLDDSETRTLEEFYVALTSRSDLSDALVDKLNQRLSR